MAITYEIMLNEGECCSHQRAGPQTYRYSAVLYLYMAYVSHSPGDASDSQYDDTHLPSQRFHTGFPPFYLQRAADSFDWGEDKPERSRANRSEKGLDRNGKLLRRSV